MPVTRYLQVPPPGIPVGYVCFVGGLHEWPERRKEHDGYQQEADQDPHERESDRPADEDSGKPDHLIQNRPHRVRRHRRRVVPVDQPDHKRRNRPQKPREDVEERGQMGHGRPRPLAFEAHRAGEAGVDRQVVLMLDAVVRRIYFHGDLLLWLTAYTPSPPQGFAPPGSTHITYFPFSRRWAIMPASSKAYRLRHICGTSIYN